MRLLATVLALLLAVSASAQRPGLYWNDGWPYGTPDPTRWPLSSSGVRVAEGDSVQLANAYVTFELHVNPERPALYEISRFVFCESERPCDPETIVWLRPNGIKAHVYYRFQRRTWRTLWLGKEWYWYQLPVDSPEYRTELHRAARLFRVAQQLNANRLHARDIVF